MLQKESVRYTHTYEIAYIDIPCMFTVWVVTHTFLIEMSNSQNRDYKHTGTVGYLNLNRILKGEGVQYRVRSRYFSALDSNKKESVPVRMDY